MPKACLVLLLLWPGAAAAAACCVGSTTAEAGRLGPCEFFTVGVATSLEGRLGAWDHAGELRLGSDARLTHRWSGSAALRPSRTVQLGVVAPFLLQWKRVAGVDGVGGAPGDVLVWASLEPFEDSPVARAAPLPQFGFAVTVPTGVQAEDSAAPVGAGATGSGHVVLLPSLRLGRNRLRGSVFGDAQVGVSLPRPGPLRMPGVSWGVSLSGAWFARTDLSLSLAAGLRGLGPGLVGDRVAGRPSMEPWLGAGLALSTRREGRILLGLRHSLPLPAVGRSQEATVLLSFGVAYVTKRRPLPARES